jgi:hypothetical protein
MQRFAAITAALFVLVPATAQASSSRGDLSHAAKQMRNKVVMKFGQDAAGRDIVKYGVRFVAADHSKQTRRAKLSELRRYKDQLARIAHPTLRLLTRTVGPPSQRPAGVQTASARAPAGGVLAAIRQCESGGNYSTDTGNGFFGAYQFTQSTWASVGGSGNPAAASPAEQDKRAAMLHDQQGASPWPVCGR